MTDFVNLYSDLGRGGNRLRKKKQGKKRLINYTTLVHLKILIVLSLLISFFDSRFFGFSEIHYIVFILIIR